MEKMTISQAIFKVSEIQSELNEKRYALSSQFFGPVTVNGKKIVDESKKEKLVEHIERLDKLNEEIAVLKEKIAEKNLENKIDGKSVTYVLEILRQKRAMINSLEVNLRDTRTSVESGVGAVTYAPYDEKRIREKYEKLKEETFRLSSEVDRINSTTYIEM